MIERNIYVGNLTDDPTLRFTQGGTAVCGLTIAMNSKKKDGTEEPTVFLDVTAWQDLAENVAESVSKGDRVVVLGRLKDDSYVNKDGVNIRKIGVVADEVSPSLRWARATVTKQGGGGGGQRAAVTVPDASADVPF